MGTDDPRIGQVLQGRYRIIELIDTGTMGAVYRGERVQLGRQVAVKFLHPQFARNKHLLARFEREAKAMSRLTHPHCVGVLDFGVSGSPYVVMEYAPGATLKNRLMRHGPIAPQQAVALAEQILAGLAHAHAQGIIHRDIKPANLVFNEAIGVEDQLRIVDFGLAKIGDFSAVSHDAIIVGTPHYMSPEQAQGNPATARSDVYAVGVVLFEMLTGQKPFPDDSTFQMITDRAGQEAPSLRWTSAAADASPALDRVIQRAMATSPDDRFGSALEFGEALATTPEALTPEQPDSLNLSGKWARHRPPSQGQPPLPQIVRPPLRRRRWFRLVWLLAAALCAGLLGWALLIRGRQTQALSTATRDAAAAVAARPPDAAAAAVAARPPAPDAPRAAITDDAAVSGRGPDGRAVDQASSEPPGLQAGIRRAHQLAADYNAGAALKLLADLRERYPKSAYAPFLQGHLYAQHQRWSKALKAYQDAIAANPVYGRKAELIRNVIGALASRHRATRHLAARMLAAIGDHAIPYLKAARALGGPRVQRREIARLLRKLVPPKPASPVRRRKKRKKVRRQ